MANTKQQNRNVEALAREYASTVFGVDYRDDIRNIPEGRSGPYQVKDDVNVDEGYIFQALLREGRQAATNDPAHTQAAHRFFLARATGRVLISGLGLGDSLHAVLQNPDVTLVRVVEKEPDIIDLVAPSFADAINAGRVEIVQGDIFKYAPNEDFDCVYHAIWSSEADARAAVEDRRALHERFESRCDWQGFMYLSPRGGFRRGAGRRPGTTGPNKPEEERRSVKKGVRYTPQEIKLIRQAVELSGKTESEVMIRGALKEAARIVYDIDDSRLDKLISKLITV